MGSKDAVQKLQFLGTIKKSSKKVFVSVFFLRPMMCVWRPTECMHARTHTHTYMLNTDSSDETGMLGCNNGGGGGNFSKVKRLVAKWIGTRKRLLSGFSTAQV